MSLFVVFLVALPVSPPRVSLFCFALHVVTLFVLLLTSSFLHRVSLLLARSSFCFLSLAPRLPYCIHRLALPSPSSTRVAFRCSLYCRAVSDSGVAVSRLAVPSLVVRLVPSSVSRPASFISRLWVFTLRPSLQTDDPIERLCCIPSASICFLVCECSPDAIGHPRNRFCLKHGVYVGRPCVLEDRR